MNRHRMLWLRSTMACLGVTYAPQLAAQVTAPTAQDPQAQEPAPAADVRGEARRLFVEASALANAGDWQGALRLYEASYRVYPHASTLYNLGFCHAERGDWVGAWLLTTRSLDRESLALDLQLSPERRRLALLQQEAVLANIAVLRVGGRGLQTLTVDGSPLVNVGTSPLGPFVRRDSPVLADTGRQAPAALEQEWPSVLEVYLNPGAHELALKRSGETERMALRLAAGERYEVRASASSSATPPVNPTPARSADADVNPVSEPKSAELQWSRPAGLAAVSLGALGLMTAGIAGLVALDADRTLRNECPAARCPTALRETVERYETAATLTNVGLWTGTLGAVAGVSLLWLLPSRQAAGLDLSLSPGAIRVERSF